MGARGAEWFRLKSKLLLAWLKSDGFSGSDWRRGWMMDEAVERGLMIDRGLMIFDF
jgi:hypothetical protein